MDEATIRSSSGLRRKLIPQKPPRRKNQQQQVASFQKRPIVATSALPILPAKATTTTTTTSQDIREVTEKKREERDHCDEEYAEEIITKAFQFLRRPKRSRDMTASEILEYYLERRLQAQLEQQSAVGRAIDMDTSGSSLNSSLTYHTTLDTTGLAAIDESKIDVSGQFLASEKHPPQLTSKTKVPVRFCNNQLVVERQMAAGSFVANISGSAGPDVVYTRSREEDAHIYEPMMIQTQSQRSTTPIVTSTTSGCKREHRWHIMWRKLKRICLPQRNRRQKKQSTTNVYRLTDLQAAGSASGTNNL
ncbi:uncharacterized protein LOC125955359 [Anopheles darlingi]|uniref:uncharacterized protein LOC125955359 n=1 Tax=Anopheles darlingi TaxID=43151 RepID=UPI0021005D66|nr:uncharacterized protein LOC125955359 [Anopheles darlingi]XP_049542460.1 uncharacterized protein LOC125955359 [Anopheles darlingi]